MDLSRVVGYVEASRDTWRKLITAFGANDSLGTAFILASVEFHGIIAAIVVRVVQ